METQHSNRSQFDNNIQYKLFEETTSNGYKTWPYAVEAGAKKISVTFLYFSLKNLSLTNSAIDLFMNLASKRPLEKLD